MGGRAHTALPERMLRISSGFRWTGYPAVAVIALWGCPDPRIWPGAWLAAAAYLMAPWCWGRLAERGRRAQRGRCHGMVSECLVTAAVTGFTGLQSVLALAVLGALTVALTAREGPGPGMVAAALTGLGWAAGRLASPLPLLQGDGAQAALAVVLVVSVCGPIAGLAYRASAQQVRARRAVEARAAGLGDVAQALAGYLPEPLAVRLFDRRLERILERCWVTVCFVDLVGFTALVDRLAPESVIELLDDFSGTMSNLARTHGATLDKLLGDGVLLFFKCDDPAERRARARACVRMLRELESVIEGLEVRWRDRGPDAVLGVRCGVASGFSSVGDIGDATRRHYTVVGGPVNLASRLQRMAAVDWATIDGETARLAGCEGFVAVEGRPIEGISRPPALFGVPLRPGAACPSASAAGSAKVPRP